MRHRNIGLKHVRALPTTNFLMGLPAPPYITFFRKKNLFEKPARIEIQPLTWSKSQDSGEPFEGGLSYIYCGSWNTSLCRQRVKRMLLISFDSYPNDSHRLGVSKLSDSSEVIVCL